MQKENRQRNPGRSIEIHEINTETSDENNFILKLFISECLFHTFLLYLIFPLPYIQFTLYPTTLDLLQPNDSNCLLWGTVGTNKMKHTITDYLLLIICSKYYQFLLSRRILEFDFLYFDYLILLGVNAKR